MEKDYTIINGELYHWGVLGMKWGRRKNKQQTSQQVDTRSDDQKRYDSLKTKRLSEMSNAELRAYMDRMNLERQYQAANPSTKERTKRFIKTLIADVKTAKEAYDTYKSIMGVVNEVKGNDTNKTQKKSTESYTNTSTKFKYKSPKYDYFKSGKGNGNYDSGTAYDYATTFTKKKKKSKSTALVVR